MTMQLDAERAIEWVPVCPVDVLRPERGVAALVHGAQLALFRTHDGEIFAVDNHDPFSGANVMSRGIVGTRDGDAFVASPMYKQAFSLRTGRCLDEPEVALPVRSVRLVDGVVEVAA
jgi:nitrite reductase (NADH) small subunit